MEAIDGFRVILLFLCKVSVDAFHVRIFRTYRYEICPIYLVR